MAESCSVNSRMEGLLFALSVLRAHRLHRRRHLALIHSCNESEYNHCNTKTTSIIQLERGKKCFNIVQCSLIVTARYLPASPILWSNTNGCRELNGGAVKCKWTEHKKPFSNSISPQFVERIDMITIKRVRLQIFGYEFRMHTLWWQIITIKCCTKFLIRRKIKLVIISLLVVWFSCHKLNFITNNVYQLSPSVRWLGRLPSSVRARRKGKSWTHCVPCTNHLTAYTAVLGPYIWIRFWTINWCISLLTSMCFGACFQHKLTKIFPMN